jgi:hypothetical protein
MAFEVAYPTGATAVFSPQYRVPGSNVTIDEAMILFTGR